MKIETIYGNCIAKDCRQLSDLHPLYHLCNQCLTKVRYTQNYKKPVDKCKE